MNNLNVFYFEDIFDYISLKIKVNYDGFKRKIFKPGRKLC